MSMLLFLISLIQISLSHNKLDFEGRIANGDKVSADEYPWMVLLRGILIYNEPSSTMNVSINATNITNATTTTITTNASTTIIEWQFCGGSLFDLEPPMILTAAHCLDPFQWDEANQTWLYYGIWPTQVFADINRTYQPGINTSSDDTYYTLPIYPWDIHMHPLWTGNLFIGYDIALIIMNLFNESEYNIDIDYYSTLLPTLLTENDYDDGISCCETDEELEIIGYGIINENGSDTKQLRRTDMKYMNIETCIPASVEGELALVIGPDATELPINFSFSDWGYPDNFTSVDEFRAYLTEFITTDSGVGNGNIVCIIGDNTASCPGDSGGPLFRTNLADNKPEIIGVSSYYFYQCNDGFPNGYTNVASFNRWIEKTIDYAVYGITSNPTSDPTSNPTSNPIRPDETQSPTEAPEVGDGVLSLNKPIKLWVFVCISLVLALHIN